MPIILLLELAALFILSRWLTQSLFECFFLIFRSRTIAISLVTFLHFPGTVVHELAHLFTAEVLGVHTGKLTLVPEGIQGEVVQKGSVAIAQTDPFRRAAIGLAPLFAGLIALSTLSYFLFKQSSLPALPAQAGQTGEVTIVTILLYYLLFAISNSLFPSKPDLKGFPALAIAVSLIIAGFYFVGIRIGLTGQLLQFVTDLSMGLARSLGVVLAVNGIALLIAKILVILIGKITNRRIKI